MKSKLFVLACSVVLGLGAIAFAQESGPGEGRGTLGAAPQDGSGQRGNREGRQQGGMRGMQQNQFGNPLEGSGFMLLERPDVQADLKLTDQQKSDLTAAREKAMNSMRENLAQARATGANPQQMRQQMDQQMSADVKRILDDVQENRFRQIRIQIAGLRAVLAPEVQSALNLPGEQRTRINVLARNAQTESQQIMQQVRGQQITQEDARAKIQAINEKFTKDLEAAVTAEQKEALKALGGPEFKQAQRQGRPEGGARPGRPGQAGGGRPQ